MKYDAVVVGGGCGGTAAGAIMARRGLKVLLVEPEPLVGGKCPRHSYRGFKMDGGGHLCFSYKRLGEPVINEAKAKVELSRCAPPSKYFDWSKGAFISIKDHLDQNFKEDDLAEMKRVLDIVSELTDSEIDEAEQMFMFDWLKQHTDKPEVVGEAWWLGGSRVLRAWRAEDALRMLRDPDWSRAVYYPTHGGMQMLPQSLADVIELCGGEVLLNSKVDQIHVSDDSVKSVTISIAPGRSTYSERFDVDTDAVIWTPWPSGFLTIFPESRAPHGFVEKINEFNKNAVVLRSMGWSAAVPKEDLESVGATTLTTLTRKPEWQPTETRGAIAAEFFMPSNISPELSRDGYAHFYNECYIGDPRLFNQKEWILNELHQALCEVIPHFRERNLWCHPNVGTQRHISAASRQQIGFRLEGIKGMYFAGDWVRAALTAGGTGISAALHAGAKCADQVISDRN